MITVYLDEGHHPEECGLVPGFLDADDPRSARDQFNEHYAHGGGWDPFPGFELRDAKLYYPGDPPLEPFAHMQLRDELIVMYPYGWVMISQQDGSFEVCRMD